MERTKTETLSEEELEKAVDDAKEKTEAVFIDVSTYVVPAVNDVTEPASAEKSKKGGTYFDPDTNEILRNIFIEVSTSTKNDDTGAESSDNNKQKNTVKFLGEDGKPVKNTVVTVIDPATGVEKTYVTDKKGNVVRNRVVTLADGSRVFAKEDGTLAKNEKVTAKNGYSYYTDENGKILKSQVIKGAEGKKYYANRYGVLRTNALVTDKKGRQHYCTEDGSFAVSRWIQIANIKYWFSRYGNATKTKKVK